jgi:glycosyltransferase involved in cell wall biosynthesis
MPEISRAHTSSASALAPAKAPPKPAVPPLKILLTSPVFPPDLGGPAVYVPSLGRFLSERGHQVKVVAFCSDPAPKGYPFPVIAISRGGLAARYLKAFWRVWKEAKGQDVVYIQEHLALLHVWAARLRGVPTAIRIMVDGAWEITHRKGWIGGDNIVVFETKEYDWRVKLVRRLQKHWWNNVQHIIACSDFLRSILVDRYGVPGRKVQRIHNAHHGAKPEEMTETQAEAQQKFGLAPGKRYVLTICRLMGWKRVDGILRALARLKRDDVVLLIAGDGEMEQEWKRLANELGLGERANFLGNVPHKLIPRLIRAADVFVLNSEYEGLSHTLIEVQTLGTPIIATGVCGNPEVVAHEHNGLLVQPGDDAALAASISRLLDNPQLSHQYASQGLADSKRFVREETFEQVEAALHATARGDLPWPK